MDVANEVSIPKVVSIASYSMLTVIHRTVRSVVCHQDSTGDYIVRYFVSNYLLRGLQAAVNMT